MTEGLQVRVGGLFTADVDEVGIRASRYGLQQQLCAGEAGFGPGGQQAWQECDEFVEVANEMADKLAVFVPAERELDRLGQQVSAKRDDDLSLGVRAGVCGLGFGAFPEKGGGARDGEGGIFHN